MWYLLRRAVFVTMATAHDDYLYLQILSLSLLNSLYYLYLGHTKPQKLIKANRVELLNEFVVQILIYHMFCFSDFANVETHFSLANSFISIVLLLMFVDVAIYAPEMYLPLKKKYYHWKITKRLIHLEKQKKIEEAERKKMNEEARAKEKAMLE